MITALGKVAFSYIAEGYRSDYNFDIFDFITTEDSCYLSVSQNNRGNNLNDITKWVCIAKGSQATAAARAALEAASAATTAAGNANGKADYAKDQGDYALEMAVHYPYIADGSEERPGDTNFWYLWSHAQQQYVKGPYAKGDNLEFSNMTQEEKERLTAEILSSLSEVTQEEAAAVFGSYEFATTD